MSTHTPLRRRHEPAITAGSIALAVVLSWPARAGAQDVIEGETTVVNLRETDGRLGPLVTSLVAMGVGTLVATIVFWWMTRPKRHQPGGTPHG